MKINEVKACASRSKDGLISVDLHTPAEAALKIMRDAGVRHLILMKDGAYFAMVDEGDLLRVTGGCEWTGNARCVTVAEASRLFVPVVTADTDIRTALSVMLTNGITALPVERNGKVCDIITAQDMLDVLDTLLEKPHVFQRIVEKGESALATPLSQKLMLFIGEAGI